MRACSNRGCLQHFSGYFRLLFPPRQDCTVNTKINHTIRQVHAGTSDVGVCASFLNLDDITRALVTLSKLLTVVFQPVISSHLQSDCSWWAPMLHHADVVMTAGYYCCPETRDTWPGELTELGQQSWQCFNRTLLKAKTHISCQAWSCETLKRTPCWASNFSGSIINGQCYLFMCIFANYAVSN